MSRDSLVPRIFSEIHPRFQTPWRSNLLFALFVAQLGGFLPLKVVGHMTNIGTLFASVIVCAGVLVMYSLGIDNWIRLVVWLAIGQVIFFTYSRKHSRLTGEAVIAAPRR